MRATDIHTVQLSARDSNVAGAAIGIALAVISSPKVATMAAMTLSHTAGEMFRASLTIIASVDDAANEVDFAEPRPEVLQENLVRLQQISTAFLVSFDSEENPTDVR